MSHHSPFSNCEEDLSSKLLGNMKKFVLYDVPSENIDLELSPELRTNLINTLFHKKTKVGKCILTYYADFVAKKLEKIISKYACEMCKKN